jgi:hypothetical protein
MLDEGIELKISECGRLCLHLGLHSLLWKFEKTTEFNSILVTEFPSFEQFFSSCSGFYTLV